MFCDAAISCMKAYRSTLSEKKVCNMSWIIYSQNNNICHFLIILSSLVDNIQHYRPWQWCLSSNICLYEMFYPSEAYREYRQFGLVPNILGKWHSIIKLLTLFSHSIILTCPKCIFDRKRSSTCMYVTTLTWMWAVGGEGVTKFGKVGHSYISRSLWLYQFILQTRV